jgi:hypothetical protein
LLSRGYSLIKDKSYGLSYEGLVENPVMSIKGLLDYLELDFDETILSNFISQDTKGTRGDPTGVKKYTEIDTSSLTIWKETFATNYRKNYY